MFQAMIEQAHGLIERLYACAEKGRNDVPLAVSIRYSEYEAWGTAAHRLVTLAFGQDTDELARWVALGERRATLLGEARRADVKRGEFFGLIDYFNLAIGMLHEFEATYQHDLAMASAAPPAAEAPAEYATPNGHEQAPQPLAVVSAPPPAPAAAPDPPPDPWSVTVALNERLYGWLAELAALRDQTPTADKAAIARLITTILERVATQTQRQPRAG
jgi:hypothetical protein